MCHNRYQIGPESLKSITDLMHASEDRQRRLPKTFHGMIHG